MAQNLVYEMQFSYEAPDIKRSEQIGREVTQFFEEGEMVIGTLYRKNNILVEDRYVIPLDYVEKSDKFPYLKKNSKFDETINRVKAQTAHMSEKEADKLDKIGENIKETVEGRTKKRITNEAKAYKNGALLGLAGGVVTALYLKKSLWVFGILGVAVGGYVAHHLHKAKKGNNDVKPVTLG